MASVFLSRPRRENFWRRSSQKPCKIQRAFLLHRPAARRHYRLRGLRHASATAPPLKARLVATKLCPSSLKVLKRCEKRPPAVAEELDLKQQTRSSLRLRNRRRRYRRLLSALPERTKPLQSSHQALRHPKRNRLARLHRLPTRPFSHPWHMRCVWHRLLVTLTPTSVLPDRTRARSLFFSRLLSCSLPSISLSVIMPASFLAAVLRPLPAA